MLNQTMFYVQLDLVRMMDQSVCIKIEVKLGISMETRVDDVKI